MPSKLRNIILFFVPTLLSAQDKSDLQQILDRLTKLEQENRNLTAEVHALRTELAAARSTTPAVTAAPNAPNDAIPVQAQTTEENPPLNEQVAVNKQRISDLAQSKVESSHKLPVSLTGMVLFNSFLNGRASGGAEYPTTASFTNSSSAAGATLSQTVLGLKFDGPEIFGGGHVNGNVYMDFWGGTPSNSLNHLIRLRTATISLDWANTSFVVGQDKPIISPREPNSLAQVAFSPLTGAGNLWLWQPQARIEQRLAFGADSGLTAQVGVYQTSEPSYASRGGDTSAASSPRPGLEGRFEFWHRWSDTARIEIAPGFHVSATHVDGFSVPSRIGSVDWLIQPSSKIQFTGMFFAGENVAGVGGLHQGFTVISDYNIAPIHALGGWGQLSYFVTKRLTFNIYAGEENDRASDLLQPVSGATPDIHRNFLYAGNAIYRLGSNVLLGFEASQVRTDYFMSSSRLNNHYDIALGYLF